MSDHEIRGPAVGLRHLPVDGNLGVGVGRQLLDGGHRIAVEVCDQGFNDGQRIRRQIGVVVMHEIVLVNRQLGLLAAILVLHPDVMLGTASAAAAPRFRQRHVRCLRTREEIGIVVLRTMEQLERVAPEEMDRIVRHQFRHRAGRGLHVVRHDAIIVIRSQRRVVAGRTRRETVIVFDAVAGDVVEDLQISCEVGNDFNEAR